MFSALLSIHIAAGIAAILSGAIAVAVPKGSAGHLRAGNVFAASMIVLGLTASMLEPYRNPRGSPLAGVIVCYFVATSWVTARRRKGTTGVFEGIACAVALGMAAAIAWGGLRGGSTTPVGSGPIFLFAGLFLVAGLLDLNALLRRKLTPAQRIGRHLWRMCFAFFIATGSFFLGQQKVMPEAVRGSIILFALAFAPFAVMLFWLVRIRVAKSGGSRQGRFLVPVVPAQPVPEA